jgi:tetratricopeptide (TPR) repeat protein
VPIQPSKPAVAEPAAPPWQELVAAGRSSRLKGDRTAALKHFRHALALQPGHKGLPVEVAAELRALGRLDESDQVLHALLTREPRALNARGGLGHNARRRGQHEQALAWYERELALQPGHPRLSLDAAVALRCLGRDEDARPRLQALLALSGPGRAPAPALRAQVHAELALIARSQGCGEQALHQWQTAHALEPQHERWPFEAALELRELGRLDEGGLLLQQVLPHHSRPARIWHAMGQVAQYRDDAQEALRCFEQAIAAEPDWPDGYLSLAAECLRLGLVERAELALHKGASQVPASLRLELALARLERCSGQWYLSRARLLELHLRHPDDPETALHLVDAHIQLAFFDDARTLLGQLAARGAAKPHALAIRHAQLARARYDLPAAQHHLATAVQLQPTDVATRQLCALVALMQGDTTAAELHLQISRSLLSTHASRRQRNAAPGGLRAMIWRESRTNPFAERALQASQTLPATQRLAALAAAAADEPLHFGTAVAWLVAMNDHGSWTRWQPAPTAESSGIPHRIMQFWDSPQIPADILSTMQSWPQGCSGFEHQVFNDASADAFVARHGSHAMLRALRSANHPAMRSDIFRLVWLWVQGGVYADADDLCRRSIAPWLAPGLQLLLLQEDIGSIGNNFIAAEPGNPFIKAALDAVVANVLGRQGDSVWFISGPGALTTAFTGHFQAAMAQGQLPPGVRVIDTWHMQRQAISMHLPRRYKQDERHWSSAEAQVRSLFRPPVGRGAVVTEPTVDVRRSRQQLQARAARTESPSAQLVPLETRQATALPAAPATATT